MSRSGADLLNGSGVAALSQKVVSHAVGRGHVAPYESLGAADRIMDAFRILADQQQTAVLDTRLLAKAGRQKHPAIRYGLDSVIPHVAFSYRDT